MRNLLLVLALLPSTALLAGTFTLHVEAPGQGGRAAVLYRYDDLYSLRTIRLTEAVLDVGGNATLSGPVEGTQRARLRIGDVVADLYLRPGSELHVQFPRPDGRTAKSLSGTTRVDLTFVGIDALDINALTSDLNARLDAFVSEDLATDQVAGMQALEVHRQGGQATTDTLRRPPTLFVMPSWSAQRLDSFEMKLRHFYREVDDPWFSGYLEYAIAGMRTGPRSNDLDLHARYLKDRPAQDDNPEYVRFVRGLFNEHLAAYVLRHHEAALVRAMLAADTDSLLALFARHDLLRDDARLCELVLMDQLYLNYHTKPVVRSTVRAVLEDLAGRSAHDDHRRIAANMLWDLTAMREGSALPPMRLEDLKGREVAMDSMLAGATCIAITAGWCTYCEVEMAGLEQLHKEYKGLVRIVAISLDPSLDDVKRYLRKHPAREFLWLHAPAEQQLRDDLRLRSLPAFFLLNDGVLVSAPAPAPSAGLGEWFHRARVAAEQEGKIKVWDD